MVALVFIFLGASATSAQAASASYQAKAAIYSPAQKLTLKAGAKSKIKIDYRNLGKTTWLNSGTNALKVKADATAQKFSHPQWLSATTPIKLYYPAVKTGETIWFEIPITVPQLNGTYNLEFSLLAGATAVTNSAATFTITVTGGKNPPAPATDPTKTVSGSPASPSLGGNEVLSFNAQQKSNLPVTIDSDNYQLKFNGQTIDSQKLGPRFQIDFNFDVKRYFINNQYGTRVLMTDQPIDFVPTDSTAQLKLTAGLPADTGSAQAGPEYSFCGHLQFNYQAGKQALTILTDAPATCAPKLLPGLTPVAPTPPAASFWQIVPTDINIINDLRMTEPTIKVGLLYQTDQPASTGQSSLGGSEDELPFKIHTLNQAPYEIRDDQGGLLTLATSGDYLSVDFDFKLKKYFLIDSDGKRLTMTDQPLHFIARSPDTIFEIASWKNGPFWGMNVNDNDYRGDIIIKYNSNTDRLWLINEIAMEEYMKGMSEISDSWPIEMLKAQQIAARTYAMFRYINPKYTNSPDPDDDPIFTVRSTQADQVYRGYQAELRNPNLVAAATATRGIIATYNNDPILAYYFSQSNGRTRSSVEAGMTRVAVDYLPGVVDPPGEGKTLKGHGVGLPQYGGKAAADQGANYSQILKYYYRGIDLKKFYP